MLVELIGSGGVGKTTVEPLIASRLGIACHPGKRDGLENEAVWSWGVFAERTAAVLHSPTLFSRAFRALDRPFQSRLRFGLDTSRRDRLASKAAQLGGGVVPSGPVHGLCAASARYKSDTTSLVAHVRHADVYVYLTADVNEISRRLRQRREISEEDVILHWRNYNEAASKAFDQLECPIVEVDATPAPSLVADEVARRLQSIMEMEFRP